MSTHPAVVLKCAGERCLRRLVRLCSVRTMGAATTQNLELAASMGWSINHQGHDYCPGCLPREDTKTREARVTARAPSRIAESRGAAEPGSRLGPLETP